MKVSELFSSPAKWTKYTWSRDGNGLPVGLSKTAVCWCLEGALYHCYRASKVAYLKPTIEAVIGEIHLWNDMPERTFEDVKKLVEQLDI